MAKKKRSEKTILIDRLLDQMPFLLVAFIVNTCLVGGAAYILFQLPDEIANVAAEITRLEIKEKALGTFSGMLDQYTVGSIGGKKDTNSWSGPIFAACEILKQEQFSESTGDSLIDWFGELRTRLYTERGAISGYRFMPEHEENLKQTFVAVYDSKIDLVVQFEQALSHWSTCSLDKKESLLKDIESNLDHDLMHNSELGSAINQTQSGLDAFHKEFRQKLQELMNQTRLQKIRAILAIVGIMLGVLLYGFYFHRRLS